MAPTTAGCSSIYSPRTSSIEVGIRVARCARRAHLGALPFGRVLMVRSRPVLLKKAVAGATSALGHVSPDRARVAPSSR
jgi:hypothetical protein